MECIQHNQHVIIMGLLTSHRGCRFPLPLPQVAHTPLQRNDPNLTSGSGRMLAIHETDVRLYIQTSC